MAHLVAIVSGALSGIEAVSASAGVASAGKVPLLGAAGLLAASLLGTGTANATTVLYGDGTWAVPTAIPAGADTQVQYNNGGVMAGSPNLTFIGSSGTLRVPTLRLSAATVDLYDYGPDGPGEPSGIRFEYGGVGSGIILFEARDDGKAFVLGSEIRSMAFQANTGVSISGGAIDGTPIGATAQSTGGFTTLTTSGQLHAITTGGASHRVSYNSASETVALMVENTGGGATQLRVNTASQSYALRNVSVALQVYDITGGAALGTFNSAGFNTPLGILSTSPTHGVGYAAGAGGSVTQLTSKSTAVTLNAACGQVTMHNAALADGAIVSFTINNSTVGATDVIAINHYTTGSIAGYIINARATAGAITVHVNNQSGSSRSEALVLRFAVIKAAIS